MNVREHHSAGTSIPDAVALLTTAWGDDQRNRHARYDLIMGVADDGGAERLVALAEALAVLSAAMIESLAGEIGVDPAQMLSDFALCFEQQL